MDPSNHRVPFLRFDGRASKGHRRQPFLEPSKPDGSHSTERVAILTELFSIDQPRRPFGLHASAIDLDGPGTSEYMANSAPCG